MPTFGEAFHFAHVISESKNSHFILGNFSWEIFFHVYPGLTFIGNKGLDCWGPSLPQPPKVQWSKKEQGKNNSNTMNVCQPPREIMAITNIITSLLSIDQLEDGMKIKNTVCGHMFCQTSLWSDWKLKGYFPHVALRWTTGTNFSATHREEFKLLYVIWIWGIYSKKPILWLWHSILNRPKLQMEERSYLLRTVSEMRVERCWWMWH